MKLTKSKQQVNVTQVSVTRHVSQSVSYQSVGASMTLTADVKPGENAERTSDILLRRLDSKLADVVKSDHDFIMQLAKANKHGRA